MVEHYYQITIASLCHICTYKEIASLQCFAFGTLCLKVFKNFVG